MKIKPEQVLWVYYEDLKADTVKQMNRVAQHIGISGFHDDGGGLISDEDYERVVANSTLEVMKQKRRQMQMPRMLLREGKSGGYQGVLSKEQIAAMDEMTWAYFHGTSIKYFEELGERGRRRRMNTTIGIENRSKL